MKLPLKKKPGDPVLARDWNLLLDALAARSPRQGSGLELISSSGGFAYSLPPGAAVPRQALPPFAVIGIHKAGNQWEVYIKEGWVIERKPKSYGSEPAVKFWMPKVGETTLDTVPRPKLTMNFEDYLYCKYETNVEGELSGDPEMIVSSDELNGVHYKPVDPEESGIEGTYYVKILKLESDDGTPRVKVYQQSDIEHWAQLWTGENLGSGARVYKKHEDLENVFKFRTIIGDEPTPKSLSELLGDGSSLFEFIELDLITEVVEEGDEIKVKGTVKVPVPAGARDYFYWMNDSVTHELTVVRRLVESPGFMHDSCDCPSETSAPPPP